MKSDKVSKKSMKRLLGLPAVRRHLDIPPGTHDTGGDGFDDKKELTPERARVVAKLADAYYAGK